MPFRHNSSSFNIFWSRNYNFLATVITLYITRLQTSRGTMLNEANRRGSRDLPITMARSRLVDQYVEGTPTPPDSGISMFRDENRFGTAMDEGISRVRDASVTIDHDGFSVTYSLEQLTRMGAELASARAEGLFPPTTAAPHDVQATAHDYVRLLALTNARGTAPRQEWNYMPNVVQLLVRITQEIQARDNVTAERTEEERVRAHVSSMMSGVGAEAKLYSIVQHAVTYAIKNGSSDQAANLSGHNMVDLLTGIRDVVKDMASQHTHNINGANMEAVLEDVFGVIDFALGNFVDPVDKNVQQMDDQLNRVDNQINHVDGQINAIGHHVSAIDGHVHALGNNINAMGTLLNSTNGNVISMTTQVNILQTIINMLPQMIQQSLQERIPEALNSAMSPIIESVEAQLGVALATPPTSPTSTIFTDVSQDSMLLPKQKKSKRSSLKKLLKLFKISGCKASF
ncbi:hypothetical protein F5Y06DRAFT_200543 [Hypoxylon sp. FL0890]|nr:hypothetical protein F5Y06DRAFT_200543 [Hypoxylon sp. FL0890]